MDGLVALVKPASQECKDTLRSANFPEHAEMCGHTLMAVYRLLFHMTTSTKARGTGLHPRYAQCKNQVETHEHAVQYLWPALHQKVRYLGGG